MGLPSEQDWPKNAAVMRSNFQTSRTARHNLDRLIPDIEPDAKDLLEVRTQFKVVCT
jgi:hypothetical protein